MANHKNIADFEIDEDNTLVDRYLSFLLGEQTYALPIEYVMEIIGIQKITHVPNIKKFLKGIINLRGIIVPIIDVRLRFGMSGTEYTERTCIIVVKYDDIDIGLIVDEVSEVIDIPKSLTSPPPNTYKGSESKFIESIGKLGEDLKIILDLNKLLYADYSPTNN